DRGNLLGEVTVIRLTIALVQGDFARTLELGRQALAYLSDDQLPLRALTTMSLGSAHTGLGDLEAAGRSFAQSSALYQAAGYIELALVPLRQLARVQLVQGRLNQLDQTTHQALRLSAEWGQRSSLVGYAYLSLGELCYQRNDLAAAARSFAEGLALVDLGGARDILNVINLADGHLGLARVKHAQGDPQGALELIGRMELIVGQLARGMQLRSDAEEVPTSDRQAMPSIARPRPIQAYFDQIAAYRVWLSHGDIGAASEWMQTSGVSLDDDIKPFHEGGLIALARVLLAQGEYGRALALLAQLLDAAEAGGWNGRVIELLALQALALRADDREFEALVALERALRLAAPEGYIRIFVDEGAPIAALLQKAHPSSSVPSYIEKLLAAFPEAQSDRSRRAQNNDTFSLRDRSLERSHALVEPLTARELEVLRLLADGASNGEIAQSLIVGLSTVKKHISNIFGKLDAQSRTQAIARARALKLL
ncbi:MAG TPA: LuxR C-terminal-related transcriptional regulator, partial [Roseiflexaceae bacterium]|nr:LuxR C-terminal-related transcriptional regulator [Roseiflexaceae bacterium]